MGGVHIPSECRREDREAKMTEAATQGSQFAKETNVEVKALRRELEAYRKEDRDVNSGRFKKLFYVAVASLVTAVVSVVLMCVFYYFPR
ncbi:MAG: hypothetical protein OXR07_03155 [Nitrospira sp.]|nr:hypothetical protein [Nitrospira sp.]